MAKVLVVHDAAGRIVTVGQVRGTAHGGMNIFPSPGRSVVEVEVSDELAKKPLIDIHHHCVFDIKSKKIMLRDQKTHQGA
jgi:hypothetical protein